ncbi:MAG: DivIVA domain-containing protein [Myxococcota bacterium]|nr:DivIVA domain-containing protein [Myxococcota bacterium]
MKLTPIDIQQQQFRTALSGFDKKEVDAFLDLVASSFEELLHENNRFQAEVRRLESSLDDYREREKALKETMITATRISEDIKEGARKESQIVIGQAEMQAEQIIHNAHQRLLRIMEDIDELKRQKAQFESGLSSMLKSHEKLLKAMSERENSIESVESLVSFRKSEAEPSKSGTGKSTSPRAKLSPVPRKETPQLDRGETSRRTASKSS